MLTREDRINGLKRELGEVRKQSVQATRQGDFLKVARLTARAATLNRSIMQLEAERESDPRDAALAY
jgi:uncharacterized small protein (DUF1192 family)